MAATLPSTAKSRPLNSFSSHPKQPPPFDSRLVITKSKKPQPLELNGRRKLGRNASFLPVVKAQSSQEYTLESKFYKIEAILRPWRVSHVSSGLLKMGIRGVTVSDVRGFGAQGGSTERQAGSEFSEDKFLAKVKMEIVVTKDQVEEVIDKIIEEARTGEIGDGKIFLIPVADVIRVRTGERGENAERMTGGRSDMFSSAISI
ncbi:nitrogen regulatory protein P-II homolog [Magnolia sinica]|uniref:nitrogen regulatory protein P-II homolog n=1 Tax=Magnolia sinica TaxID=86752 RepID=UPI00265902E3|nr:nitrogen regulatory protein P-II homolog [Magnolia sinica]